MAITTQMRTDVAGLYAALFGRAPERDGLGYWVEQMGAGKTLAQVAQDMYNVDAARAIYPKFLTNQEVVGKFYTNVLGRTADADGLAYWTAKLNATGATAGSVIAEMITAVKAYAGTDAEALAAKALFNNKVDVGINYAVDLGLNDVAKAADVLKLVTATDTTAAKALASGTSTVGQTFALTAGADALTGTAGDDTFVANVVVNPANGLAEIETLTGLDAIVGGAGNDTLNYTTVGGAAVPLATLTSIEVLNVVSDGAVTADVSGANVSGITTITGKATGAAVDIDAKANVTSVIVTGTATTVDIDDAGTAATSADKIASVSITGATGAINIGATNAVDSLTSLSLTQANGGATIAATAGTRALTLTLNELTAGTIADGEATGLTVNTTGKATAGVTINAAKATAVTINADEKLTVAALGVDAAKTITIKGDSLVTLTSGTYTALTSVDSTASTGGVTITSTLGTGVAFAGGAGKDSVDATATTKAVTLGAGDDTLTLTAAVGVGGSVDGGEGSDTLSMTAANATTLSGSATFENGFSNFEKVKIGASATTVANTVNLANLDDISYLISAGVVAGVGSSLTVTNMASNGTFEQTGVIGGASSISLADSSGSADVLNIKLNGAANIVNTAALTVANVETINITATDSSADTTTLTNPAAASTILLAAANATKITVSGNHGVDFTGSTLTKVVNLDATGVVSLGDTATATATQIGTTGAVTFSSAVTDKAVTVATGNGADVINVSSINDATFLATDVTASTISTGAGNDTIVGSAGKDVIDGGAGNDTITGGAAADTLTGGAGIDIFVYATADGSDSTLAKLDVITDFVANTFGQGTNGAATSAGALLADKAKWTGDVLQINVGGAISKVSVGVMTNAADAQTYIQNVGADADAALTGMALDSTSGKFYVDLDGNGTIDSVIQLTGVTTLNAAAILLV